MALINFIEIETRSGYRSFEIHKGDITNLGFKVDMIGVSAYSGDYFPKQGTVIRAFYEKDVNYWGYWFHWSSSGRRIC